MSERSFSRRRRGMRFRPTGGLGHAQPQRSDREALQARAEATAQTSVPDRVYESRHNQEIERAENLAVGLPPEGAPEAHAPASAAKGDFREPNLATPAQVQE